MNSVEQPIMARVSNKSHRFALGSRRRSSRSSGAYLRWRRWLDPLCASLLLIPAAPAIAAMVLAVRLTSRGPAIYRQRRVGLRGAVFVAYKIRTMHVDAERETGPVWATPDDPRVTPLGRWLREKHLDELPQLFNVLRGQMLLIGPRPERPEFVETLSHEVPRYLDRLTVPPGLTGLAQVNLPSDTTVANVRRKVALDLQYVRHASLLLDCRILACTLAKLLGFGSGLLARRLGIDDLRLSPHLGSLE
jgi:lipopolysaccharide/colanic/teichoic acid biosynthesis glycosyltransferase